MSLVAKKTMEESRQSSCYCAVLAKPLTQAVLRLVGVTILSHDQLPAIFVPIQPLQSSLHLLVAPDCFLNA